MLHPNEVYHLRMAQDGHANSRWKVIGVDAQAALLAGTAVGSRHDYIVVNQSTGVIVDSNRQELIGVAPQMTEYQQEVAA